MVMFTGEYRHSLDAKNRLIIPSKIRDQIATTVYVTEWLDGCLGAFTQEEWDALLDKLSQMPMTNAKARMFIRHITGKADACTIDPQGRIVLPQFQIKDLDFQKNAVIVGAGNHFEIWPQQRYDDYLQQGENSLEAFAEDLTGFL